MSFYNEGKTESPLMDSTLDDGTKVEKLEGEGGGRRRGRGGGIVMSYVTPPPPLALDTPLRLGIFVGEDARGNNIENDGGTPRRAPRLGRVGRFVMCSRRVRPGALTW